MSGKRLTTSQRYMLALVSDEWAEMPSGIGCTSGTLAALEKSGVIETRVAPGQSFASSWRWQWRKTPDANHDR